jgi:tetraacyldisaccharide 4'-kinase
LNQEAYRKLISSESGCRCPFVGLGLSFAAQVYSLVIRLRNFLYDKGWLKAHRVNAKVLSVGNLTVGGTGKTPLVVWMCNKITKNLKLKTKNCGCAILTRGYKATQNSKPKTQNYGDEPAILAESCPETKVIINPDRVAGANEAITKFGAKVLVMDDGFQHRRLHRDLDIVTIDATLPFGYGRMLPAGLLREPVAALKRADAIVITRCDQISQSQLIEIEAKLQEINPNMVITRSIHNPVCAKLADGKEIGIEQLKGKKIFAFCGIGNPQAFLGTIKGTGAEVVGSKIYDDHHHYTPSDKSSIYEQAGNLKAELILTTQKDRSKLIGDFRFQISDFRPPIPLAYLAIEIRFVGGEDKIRNLIENTLAGKIS